MLDSSARAKQPSDDRFQGPAHAPCKWSCRRFLASPAARRGAICCLAAAWLVLASTELRAQGKAGDPGQSFAGEPIVIQVPSTLLPDPIEVQIPVALNPELKEVFQNLPIIWAPDKKQSPLVSVSVPHHELSLGPDPAQDVLLDFDFTKPQLSADRPQQLTLRIRDPRRLEAGIYEGSLRSSLRTVQNADQVVPFQWPIVIVVHGRRVLDLTFRDAATGGASLPMGEPATVLLRVETVEAELGRGQLKVEYLLDDTPASKPQRVLEMPVPLEAPIDPRIDVKRLDGFCDDLWADTIIWTRLVHKDGVTAFPRHLPKGNPRPAVRVHELEIALPDAFAMGILRVTATFDRPPKPPAAKTAGGTATLSRDVRVSPGIHIYPKAASVGERVAVSAEVERDLGDEITLAVPGLDPPSVSLRRAGKQARVGVVRYQGGLALPRTGAFTIHAAGKQAEALPQPVEVRGLYLEARNVDQPLLIYRGAAPPSWSFCKAPAGGAAWTVVRKGAFGIQDSTHELREARVILNAVQRYGAAGESKLLADPADWEREPQFSVPSSFDAGAAGELPPAAGGAETGGLVTWNLSSVQNDAMAFDLKASILPEGDTHSARHELGDRSYLLRLRLDARDATGAPVGRIFVVPFKVSITQTTWRNYVCIVLVGLVMIVVIGLVTTLVIRKVVLPMLNARRAKESSKPKRRAREEGSMLSDGDSEDEPEEESEDRKRGGDSKSAGEQSMLPDDSENEDEGSSPFFS